MKIAILAAILMTMRVATADPSPAVADLPDWVATINYDAVTQGHPTVIAGWEGFVTPAPEPSSFALALLGGALLLLRKR